MYNTACKAIILYTPEVFTVAKNLDIIMLLDVYGEMLTVKQREFLDFYYNDDLSLSEIADNVGITRQGVRDSIKRAEAQLEEMEEKLAFVRRFRELRAGLEEISAAAAEINKQNLKCGLSMEINDLSVRIQSVAAALNEQ